jgi:hypothetical protein
MATRIHSTWLNTRNTRIYCVDLSSFNDDPDGLTREIDAARAVIEHLPENSLLVSLDLHSTRLTVEIERFLRDITRPVRKMAVLGVPGLRRAWYNVAGRAPWPPIARFFDDFEKAKDWLASEGF